MKAITTQRALIAIGLIAVVYWFARANGWTGPGAYVPIVEELLVPAVILVSAWGLYRLSKGGHQ